MEKFKKRVSVFLALVLCVNMLQLTAFAEETEWTDEVQTSDGDTVTVEGTQTTTTQETATGETTTDTSWSGDNVVDDVDPPDPVVTVTGSETTTTTTTTTDPDTNTTETETEIITVTTTETKTATETSGSEIITEITEGEDETHDGSSEITVPVVDSSITVQLTQQEDGIFSGSDNVTLDWEKFTAGLKDRYGVDMSGLWENGGTAVSDDGLTEVLVSEDGSTVTVVEYSEASVTAPEVEVGDGTPVDLANADPPDGFETVTDANGNVTYQKSETVQNEDGSKTTTTTIITAITRAEGQNADTQIRTVTTTIIDLSNTNVTIGVNAELGEFTATSTGVSTETHGVTKNQDNVTVRELDVEDSGKLAVLAELGFWGDNLDSVRTDSQIDLTADDANAAMRAILFAEEGEPLILSDDAQAFYNYLMKNIVAAESTESSGTGVQTLEGTMPTVQSAAVSNINSAEGTASVTLVVSLAPSITGDLLVTLTTQDGETQTERIKLDGDLNNENKTVVNNEDGTYTITIHNVTLNGETVDLMITTSEDITEREVYQVTTTVGASEAAIDEVINDKQNSGKKPLVERGELTFDTRLYREIYVKQANAAIIWVPLNDERTDEEIFDQIPPGPVRNMLKHGRVEIIRGSTVNGFIQASEGGTGEITAVSVNNGTLTVNGSISNLFLYSNGQEIPGTETTSYGMMETTTTTEASATLKLNLTGSLPTATMETKTQKQAVTASSWASSETITASNTVTTSVPKEGPVIVPGDDDDDDDDDVVIPGDDDGDDDVTIPEPAVPLAETPETGVPAVETPTEEIFDKEVPLAEIPEDEVPMAEIPDAMVPLADVPPTGDNSAIWFTLAALSAGGLLVLSLKKRKDEEI